RAARYAISVSELGMKILAATVLTALLFSTRAVHASDVDLSWQAPAGCPDRDSLRDGLTRRLGRPIRLGGDAPVQLSGGITAVGHGYALELRTRRGEVSDRRQLQARSCNELARASLLVLSLLLVEERPAGPDPARAAEPRGSDDAASPRPRLSARAGAVFDLG